MQRRNRLHVIVGMGLTGLSSAYYLSLRGVPLVLMDTRLDPPQLADIRRLFFNVPIVVGGLSEEWLEKADTIILSPGIPMSTPAIAKQAARGVPIIGDIELFAQAVRVPVIGITGTNAKSTVTTLVGLMAAAAGHIVQVGGNLGIPVLDLLTEYPRTTLYVLELSSFQLETTHNLRLKAATVLNVTPDHMDRYPDIAAYQAAKQRIYQNSDVAVFNADDALTIPSDLTKKTASFTLKTPQQGECGLVTKEGVTYLAYGSNLLMPASELPILGTHYQANALAALSIAASMDWPKDECLQVLRDFKGLPHRCQFVRELNGVRWYNDSKGTNVGATQAAMTGLGNVIDGKLVLIAGGVGKSADFTPLAPSIKQYCREVILIGEAAQDIAKAINAADSAIDATVPISFADNFEAAVTKAASVAEPNDSVLLSPACASFDMFKNFEHRGDVFTRLVLAL